MQKMFSVTKRQSNFELLRIIAMLCIIMHHFSLFIFSAKNVPLTNTLNNVFLIAMMYGGKFGTDIFLIISGYFLISQDFRIIKFLKLILQYWFYSIVLLILSVQFHIVNQCELDMVATALFPLTGFSWFADAYCLLYLFHPFLNIMLQNFTKTQYKAFLLLSTFSWFLIPTIAFSFKINLDVNYSNAVLFSVLYSLGAYINLFNPELKSCYLKRIALDSFMLYMVLSLFFLAYSNSNYYSVLSMNNSILVLITALSVFLLIKDLTLKNNPWINSLSACSFGIYLLHDNNLTRFYLWHDLLHVESFYSSAFFVLYAFLITILVFFACAAIDFTRLIFFEKPFFDRYGESISCFFLTIRGRIKKYLEQ